jgi:hypothetical protein
LIPLLAGLLPPFTLAMIPTSFFGNNIRLAERTLLPHKGPSDIRCKAFRYPSARFNICILCIPLRLSEASKADQCFTVLFLLLRRLNCSGKCIEKFWN